MESQLEPMVQRYWGSEEFAMALGEAGFTDVGVTGGYERRAPQAADRVLTFEAVKAGNP